LFSRREDFEHIEPAVIDVRFPPAFIELAANRDNVAVNLDDRFTISG
jgi:hypothetical protein